MDATSRIFFKSIFRLPFLLAQHLGGQLIFLDWTLLTQLVGPRSMKTQLDFYLSHNKHILTELWKGLYVLTTDRSVVGLYVQ